MFLSFETAVGCPLPHMKSKTRLTVYYGLLNETDCPISGFWWMIRHLGEKLIAFLPGIKTYLQISPFRVLSIHACRFSITLFHSRSNRSASDSINFVNASVGLSCKVSKKLRKSLAVYIIRVIPADISVTDARSSY